jgi:hypothetical protein
MVINSTEQVVIFNTTIQGNILYILPLIFPLIYILILLRGIYLSFISEKKDNFEMFSDIAILTAIVTGSIVYLKLIVDNKSIVIELVTLFISYIIWIILQYFAILEQIKITTNKKLKKDIIIMTTIVFIIIFAIPIIKILSEWIYTK